MLVPERVWRFESSSGHHSIQNVLITFIFLIFLSNSLTHCYTRVIHSAYQMASPMRRPGTSFIQFRKRIPQDVLSKARGASLAIPVGDEVFQTVVGTKAMEITVSLRTRDQREAKERQAQVSLYLDGMWQSLRDGPKQLSHKQIQALAGEVYKQLVASFEDDPGSPRAWREVVQLQANAMAGGDAARERWFGPTVDQTLASHGLVVSADNQDTSGRQRSSHITASLRKHRKVQSENLSAHRSHKFHIATKIKMLPVRDEVLAPGCFWAKTTPRSPCWTGKASPKSNFA